MIDQRTTNASLVIRKGAKRGFLISQFAQRDRATVPRFISIPLFLFLQCTGPQVPPGDRAKSKLEREGDGERGREREREREEERRGGLRRHGYRNHDLAVSTLHGSTRYLPGHLHIKLTHNARHISASAACCAPSNEPESPNQRSE